MRLNDRALSAWKSSLVPAGLLVFQSLRLHYAVAAGSHSISTVLFPVAFKFLATNVV